MKKGILIISLALMFGIVGLKVAPVYALPFYNITNNAPGDAAIGEDQLLIDVTYDEEQPQLVFFNFINNGPEQCSIAQIYFDGFAEYSEIYGGIVIINQDTGSSLGVNFAGPPTPPNLPGGENVGFEADFGIGAVSPAPINGVGPLENLMISLNFPLLIEDQFSFGDLLANLETGETRIGIHVIDFASGGSESFVTASPIPEPATMLLLGSGLLGLGVLGRKKFLKRA